MKREEIEDLMQRVKDEYIQEAMPEMAKGRFGRRSKKWFVALAGAAAVGLVCLGIYQAEHEPDTKEIRMIETKAAGGETQETSADTAPGTDYSIYFQGEPSDKTADYSLELGAGGCRYEYKQSFAVEPLGFDTEEFSEAEATVYCDAEGKPQNLLLLLSNEEAGKYLSLTVSESGMLFSCFPIEEKGGVEYQGVPVYGYHHAYPEYTSEPWSLGLYFRKDGVGYTMSSTGLNYDEAGAVMAAIFAGGLKPSSYDPNRGEECRRTLETISFERAGEIFDGNVPPLEQVAGMALEEGCRYFAEYRDGRVESELLDLCYSGGDSYLMVTYRTAPYKYEPGRVIAASELSRESAAQYGSVNDEPGLLWYSFCIAYPDYAVDITARCTEEMLWEYLGELKR
ncbi:MAG: hypothetical protein HFI93_01870 [Lachnospiraceae bacterium]|nr:hypothetical protein [Lachnospiraceae bacterium]